MSVVFEMIVIIILSVLFSNCVKGFFECINVHSVLKRKLNNGLSLSFEEQKNLDDFGGEILAILIYSYIFGGLLWVRISDIFCDTEMVESSCCVEGEYTRSGWQCYEFESCMEEVCISK